MKHSLYGRFLIGYLCLALVSFLTVAVIASRLSYQNQLDHSASVLYEQARTIANDYSDQYVEGHRPSDFRIQIQGYSLYANVRVWLVDMNGTISFDSDGALTGRAIRNFDAAEFPGLYRTGNYPGLSDEDMLSVLAPITANFETYGYILIHQPLRLVSEISDQMLRPLYIIALILFLLSLLILWMIHRFVIRPLRIITEAASEYASGNLKHKISLEQQDEIGYLAETMNVMADELSSAEEYQKHFIANVSHDFRSPLTSIKGYLTAILDGVIPPENQDKYLNVVINETERLENLTQSMLSLNSLDRQNMYLELSNFDLCQLIRDVCSTFERKCQLRNITFDLIFSAAAIYVYADMGKIQQVLYNLLDNAIKFSNNDSSITISVRLLHSKAFISVKDTGIGIPQEDIGKIWNRFFKSDLSRGKDKRGTGLGLSIVKEIITAHGETIDVISTEGAGTEFIFRLPLSLSNSETGSR